MRIFAIAIAICAQFAKIAKKFTSLPVFESKRLGLADKWSLNANQKRDSYLDYVGRVTVATELVEDDLMEIALELDVSDVKESEGVFEFIVPARGTKKLNTVVSPIFAHQKCLPKLHTLRSTPINAPDIP